jgi:hypothetical protein
MLSGYSGGGNNSPVPGATTPTPAVVPVSSMPKTYGEIGNINYILDNLRYIRLKNTNYVDDQYYTMLMTINNDPATYKGQSCNRILFLGNVTDVKGQDAIEASNGLNFAVDLYAVLDHGNISKVLGGHMSVFMLGEPQEMDIPEGDKGINLADILKQQMSVPIGEESLFQGINFIPLNYVGTDTLTIGQKNYPCHVLDLMMVPQGFLSEDLDVEKGYQINATSFSVTYRSGETEIVTLVDDGTFRYWWYPELAGYPLKVDIGRDNRRYVQTVEEWR